MVTKLMDGNSNNINYKRCKQKLTDEFCAKQFVDNLLNEGSRVPCDNSNANFYKEEAPPSFYDKDKFKRGQQFFHKQIMSMFFAKLLGLITILSVPSILKILIFTKSSFEPFRAYKRYLSTLFHMYIWYNNDLSPGSKTWRSLLTIKGKHNTASNGCNCVHQSRISQKDMALTQFGFMGFAVVRSKQLGIHDTNHEDWAAFIHIWKVLGYLLGIDEKYNICRDSVTETREICEELINRVFRVEYNKRDKDFLSMSSALINGMWHVQPLLNVNVMMAYIHKRLLELNSNSANPNCDSYMRQMSTFERFYFNYIKYSMHYKQYSIIRLMSNWLQYLALWFMQNFPFLAYYRFGIANTLVRILD